PGEFVLVIGAGPIGLGLMELSRIAGGNVIAMDVNADRLEFCSTVLDVKHIINASLTDATEQLKEITKGEMPPVVIDATGNLYAINKAFDYISHGGRYILVGLQKGEIKFSHPEFHKREATLMSSRNATREDFERVIENIREGRIIPRNYITHRLNFDSVPGQFSHLLDPANKVIKAMIEV
ncbi:MAG: alcohol dehydrogenase, partial [Chitinophagaceae bacterium]